MRSDLLEPRFWPTSGLLTIRQLSREKRLSELGRGLPLSVQMASTRPQRGHGVDAGGAPRGEITCESGDGCQQNEHADESGWVSGGYAEEEAADGASESPGRSNSDEDADGGESERLKKDTGLKFLRGSAEGHADTDFLGALGDGIRDDGVDAERGKNEREERRNLRARGRRSGGVRRLCRRFAG